MAYYLDLGQGLLIDAGSPGEETAILSFLEHIDAPPPALIFLTHSHFDHFGGAAALQRKTGAQVAVHKADAESLANAETPLGSTRGRGRYTGTFLPIVERFIRPAPVSADVLLEDGQRLDAFGIPASVIHTPGHTKGSSSLLLDSGEVFVGDLISGTGSPHIQRYYAVDWNVLGASVGRVKALQPSCVYPGHGSAISSSDFLALS